MTARCIEPERARPATPPWNCRPAGPNQRRLAPPDQSRETQCVLCDSPLQSLSAPQFCPASLPATRLSRSSCVLQGLTPRKVVVHWFTTPTSTFSLATWLLPSSLPKLLEESRTTSPLGLHPPSKLAYGLARPTDHRTRVVVDERAPLLGFLPLQRIDAERPLDAALPQPLRSVLAVSHSLDGLLHSVPSRGLPRVPLMGFLPFRGLPTTAGLAHH